MHKSHVNYMYAISFSFDYISSRLPYRLFYAMDNLHGDPITAKAQHFTSTYLEPILHEWSAPPQPLLHGLVKPYHISPTSRIALTVESALSRVLALILERLNRSTTRHQTVSDAKENLCKECRLRRFVVASDTGVVCV